MALSYNPLMGRAIGPATKLDSNGNPTPASLKPFPGRSDPYPEGTIYYANEYPSGIAGSMQFVWEKGKWVWRWGSYVTAAGKQVFADSTIAGSIVATVKRTTSQSITNFTWSGVSFETEVEDTDGIFDPAKPATLTFQTPGLYQAAAAGQFQDISGGTRLYRFSGTVDRSGVPHIVNVPDPDGRSSTTFSLITRAAAGDTIGMQVYHSYGASGTSINLSQARLSVFRLGD